MNLSQAEIDALAAGGETDSADSGGGDIMSPEAIAAMLDDAASVETDGIAVDSAAADDDTSMLDDLIAGADEEVVELTDETAQVEAPSSDEVAGIIEDEGAGTAEPGSGENFGAAFALEGMLTDDEVDILGEVGNISMGAVATTMYSLLDKRVEITTPHVTVYKTEDVLSVYKIPFVVAIIEYKKGVEGTNLLVLKVEDAALITDLLMGGDGKVEEPIELDEMHLSAMSEVMNQMMGASSTSLSKLLGTQIDIAPPKSTQVEVGFDIKEILGDMDMVTKISFDMEIEGLLKSELIQLMPYDVSRTFAKQFMDVGVGGAVPTPAAAATPAPIASPPPPPPAVAPAPAAPAPAAPTAPVMAPPAPEAVPFAPAATAPYPQQAPYEQPGAAPYPPGAPYPYPPPSPPMAAGQGRIVDVHSMQFQSFDAPRSPGEANPIGLVYNIPLQVSVELGKTKKEISEILEFNLGTIIVLEKMAGDPVEVVVNGKLLARGEVVVIDDNYGVRITEIINT